jgi:hypothetical protein
VPIAQSLQLFAIALRSSRKYTEGLFCRKNNRAIADFTFQKDDKQAERFDQSRNHVPVGARFSPVSVDKNIPLFCFFFEELSSFIIERKINKRQGVFFVLVM